METLQKLHSELGHTIILITHETSTAEHADRIIHIKDGRIDSDKKNHVKKLASKGYKK
jgi:ABC-type lipoprotein export system ATPase subunit